jgi:hypothetical protein
MARNIKNGWSHRGCGSETHQGPLCSSRQVRQNRASTAAGDVSDPSSSTEMYLYCPILPNKTLPSANREVLLKSQRSKTWWLPAPANPGRARPAPQSDAGSMRLNLEPYTLCLPPIHHVLTLSPPQPHAASCDILTALAGFCIDAPFPTQCSHSSLFGRRRRQFAVSAERLSLAWPSCRSDNVV